MPSPHGAPTGALSVHRRTARARATSAPHPADHEVQPAPAWVSGALAALQASLWSYLVVVVPAVAGFVSGAAAVTTSATWRSAVSLGSKVWLLGHGVPLEASGVTITIVPLGITLVALGCGVLSLRRTARAEPAAAYAFVVASTLVVTLVTLLAGGSVARGVLGGLVVSVLGALLALGRGERGKRLRAVGARLTAHVPVALRPGVSVRAGARHAAALVTALVMVAAALVAVWAVAGLSASEDVVHSLGLDLTSGSVLALGQTMLVPDLVLWALAWLTGAGFAVGAGTSFTPSGAELGPFPALPLLGGLPSGDMTGGIVRWAPVVVVLLAAWVSVGLWRRLRAAAGPGEVTWRSGVVAAVSFTVVAALLGVLLTLVSAGAGGPGRLATIGASPLAVAGRLALLGGVTCCVVLVVAHPAPRRALGRVLGRLWRRGTGRGAR